MFRSSRASLVLIPLLLLGGRILSASAQPVPQLELALVGRSEEYVAPAGQIATLKIEILDLGPGDVYLVQGEAYFDPNLSGNWQLIHSENTGNFHLAYLQSAIWTFDLDVPSIISARNSTNGLPQVSLLIKIIYSTYQGEQSSSAEFAMGVPGATVQQANPLLWLVVIGSIVVLACAAVAYRKISRSRSRNA